MPIPPNIVIQQRDGRFSRWFSWLGWVGLLFCLPIIVGLAAKYKDYFDATDGIQEKFLFGSQTAVDKIAVIDAAGIIADGDGFIKKQINRIKDDKQVKAVVLRVNSPGGTITGSDYLLHHLTKLREAKKIPLVVSMGAIAASGGYYVAMAVGDQERAIFAEPTTTTGSIGVIIPHYDLSGLLERLDIKDDSIVSHPRKQLLSMTHPATKEERAIIQSYLDDSFNRFKKVVQQGRPYFRKNPTELDAIATGEIFNAEKAAELHLVDEIGFLEDAVERAAELAGLDSDSVRTVTFKPQLTLWSTLEMARASEVSLQDQLLQLTVPRAYYLFTSLPVLASSATR
jgi:protease-4